MRLPSGKMLQADPKSMPPLPPGLRTGQQVQVTLASEAAAALKRGGPAAPVVRVSSVAGLKSGAATVPADGPQVVGEPADTRGRPPPALPAAVLPWDPVAGPAAVVACDG